MKLLPLALVATIALAAAGSAFAHAKMSPPVALAKAGQLFSLAVPTEKENARTTKVVLTVPDGFSIDSFVAAPGWKRAVEQTGSGEEAVIQKVTWTAGSVEPGGGVPSGEAAFFQFMGRSAAAKTYSFPVQQTYSDGSVVNWAGPEKPTIRLPPSR